MRKVPVFSAVLLAFFSLNAAAQVKCSFEDNLIDDVVPRGWLMAMFE